MSSQADIIYGYGKQALLAATATAGIGQVRLSDQLSFSKTRREMHETFLEFLTTVFAVERARVLLACDHDWIEVYSSTGVDGIVERSFERNEDANHISRLLQEHATRQLDPSDDESLTSTAAANCSGSYWSAPLSVDGEHVGVVVLDKTNGRSLDRFEEESLLEFTTELGTAISRFEVARQNPQLRAKSRNYAQQLEALTEVGYRLGKSTSEADVFKIVAAAAEEIIKADRISFVVPNLDEGTCFVTAIHGDDAIPSKQEFPLAGSAIEHVISSDRPCYFTDFGTGLYSEYPKLASHGLTSAICTPLRNRGRIIAVLNAAKVGIWQRQEAQNLFVALGQFLESALLRIRANQSVELTLKQLDHDANHDELTGLPNRSLFAKTLEREVHLGKQDASSFAVLFMDLDDFKRVNDTLSHSAGDELLKQAADRMKNLCVRMILSRDSAVTSSLSCCEMFATSRGPKSFPNGY